MAAGPLSNQDVMTLLSGATATQRQTDVTTYMSGARIEYGADGRVTSSYTGGQETANARRPAIAPPPTPASRRGFYRYRYARFWRAPCEGGASQWVRGPPGDRSRRKQLARRIVDRRVLQLLKLWLGCAVEETDDRGRTIRTTGAKDQRRGIPQGSPISPLLTGFFTEAGRVESGRRRRAVRRPDGRRRASPGGRRALVDPLRTFRRVA